MFETIYTKDEKNKQLIVEREFAAKQDRVWQAFTDSTLLEKWFAPKPWTVHTESFDFSEGGHFHYYMQGPNGEKSWGMTKYLKIQPQDFFTAFDAFCDESGAINESMPQMQWLTAFAGAGETTKVRVTLTFETLEALNKLVEMGFKEGYSMSHSNLDELLAQE